MEENKVILSEINRMRQIMGLKLIMEATIPPAVRQALLDFMGFTEKQIDALERSAGDFSDLSKLSDEFATLGIKNLDDLQRHVAQEMGIKSLNDVSDDVILKYMKQSPEIMQGVTKKLNSLVADAADAIIKKSDWQSIVGNQAADEFEFILRQPIDAENAADVKMFADNYKAIVDRQIADATANGRTVPDSLRNLSEELGEKSKQADNINTKQNKDFSQVPGNKGTTTPNSVSNVSDESIDELTERLRQQIQSSFDPNNTTSVQSQLNDIIIDLENKNLLKIPNGMSKSTVIDQITKGSGIDEKKIADVLNNMGPAEQSLYVQKQVEILTSALNRAKDNVNSSNKPSWFKKFFTKSVDETIETSNTFAKMSKIKPVNTVWGITKSYLLIGGILSISCFIYEAWQSEKTDSLPESKDLKSCAYTIGTWLPKAISMGWDWITTTTYENIPEDFKKWVEDNEYTEPDYVEGDGYSYRDKNGDRQSAIYDNEEKTFKQE